MSLWLLQVVLKSGFMTELTFNSEDTMKLAIQTLTDDKTPTDDYGLSLLSDLNLIESMVSIDYEGQLRAERAKTRAQQFEEHHGTPPAGAPPNIGIIGTGSLT